MNRAVTPRRPRLSNVLLSEQDEERNPKLASSYYKQCFIDATDRIKQLKMMNEHTKRQGLLLILGSFVFFCLLSAFLCWS